MGNLNDEKAINHVHTPVEGTPDKEPPKTSVGVLGWLKENLFSSWFNTILTFIFAWILYVLIKGTLSWVFLSADWNVITKNFALYFVGQYPKEEIWRVWTSLSIVSLLFGFSSGLWKGTVRQLSVTLSVIYAIIVVMPFITGESRVWLGINILFIYAGMFAISKIPKHKVITITGWLISFPVIIFMLHGFGVFSEVSTNLWGGLLLTVLIATVAIVASFPIGVLLALGRMSSKLPIIRWVCIAYIELIRGVPLITILFMAQLMIPLFMGGINIDNVLRVMIGATLFTAAYLAENVRGGLQSIPRGQHEAAQALGLNSTYRTTFIILPQALRAVIPAIVGQCISMFKDTALVAIVGLIDLLGIAQTIVANPKFLGKQMEAYLFIALIYWVISYSMSYASRRLEKNLGVGER